MDFLTTARSPWGESIFTHISWSLFWASLVGGVLFLLAHGGYMLFSPHHKRPRKMSIEGNGSAPAAVPITSHGSRRASLVMAMRC